MVYEFTPAVFLVHMGVAGALALVAHLAGVLDRAGSVVAFALAILILETTGWTWLLLLVAFVALGFAVTKLFFRRKQQLGVAESRTGARGWRNVAANGGVPAIMSAMTFLNVSPDGVALGFVASIATAAADTFASELGVLSNRVYLITKPWKRVPRGENGGVSVLGQSTALLGAALAGAASLLLLEVDLGRVWIPVVAGFVGCQIDSVLGALFEEERGRAYGFLSKADVNFLSQAMAGFGVLWILTL